MKQHPAKHRTVQLNLTVILGEYRERQADNLNLQSGINNL